MVDTSRLANTGWQLFDSAGAIITGGKLHCYAAGTTTNQNPYPVSGEVHPSPTRLTMCWLGESGQ